MYDRVNDANDDEPYGHVHYELRRSTVQRAVQEIENKRARRRRLTPKQRERKGDVVGRMNAAFARAVLEERELRDLKANYPTHSGLHFKRADNDNHTNEETT